MHAHARVCFSRAYPSRSPRTAQREQQLRTARTRLPAVLPATSAIAQQRLTRSPTPPLLRTTEYPGVSTLREPPNEWVQSRTGSSPRAAAVADAAGGSGALRAAVRRAAAPNAASATPARTCTRCVLAARACERVRMSKRKWRRRQRRGVSRGDGEPTYLVVGLALDTPLVIAVRVGLHIERREEILHRMVPINTALRL